MGCRCSWSRDFQTVALKSPLSVELRISSNAKSPAWLALCMTMKLGPWWCATALTALRGTLLIINSRLAIDMEIGGQPAHRRGHAGTALVGAPYHCRPPTHGQTHLPAAEHINRRVILEILTPAHNHDFVGQTQCSSTSWVTKRIVLCSWRCRRNISSWRLVRVMASRAPKGSSINIRSGSPANARTTPMRCCCPPESWAG